MADEGVPGDDGRRWKVGELAEATGLTVRTLHHFDEIGLLQPSERSPGGHRLYTDAEVRRLYQVLALRQLGVPLAEIKSLDGDLSGLIRRQLLQVEQQIGQLQQVRQHILSLLHRLSDGPTIDQLLAVMEAMMKTSYFTPDQLTRLKARHREVGAEGFQRWRARWTEIADEVRAHLAAGTDPADPEVQAAARRWTQLMDEMTGGDRSILAAMYAKMDGQGPEAATLDVVSSDVWAYVKRALAVGHQAA
ncbi:MAG: MerR family transcriptional regulator [Micromonosporaceae bacterium]|nr:MerR family transcriptional regulator [Micromonosporaceae bacterium]